MRERGAARAGKIAAALRAPAASASQSGLASVLLFLLLVRLALAAFFPLANDEAYYWDWARAPATSYLDHPPGVAWMAWCGVRLMQLFGSLAGKDFSACPLGPRLLAPFFHLAATALVFATARTLKKAMLARSELAFLLAATQLSPGLSLGGAVLLPDSGLVLAMTAALFFATWRCQKAPAFGVADGLIFGLLCGLGGDFKYHAAPLALGLGSGILVARKDDGAGKLFLFTVAAVLAAAAAMAPVWLWNWQHGFASFLFQGGHGFEGFELQFLPFLRTFIGVVLLVTPGVAWFVLRGAAQGGQVVGHRVPKGMMLGAYAFWPLVAVIAVASLGKQTLPHWVLPAFWLMLPATALLAGARLEKRSRLQAWNAGIFAAVTWILPWSLAIPAARGEILSRLGGQPGPLAELTLWPELAAAMAANPQAAGARADIRRDRLSHPECADVPEVVSLRWFWVAQLGFHLPGQPKTGSLEADRLSYYRYRDAALATAAPLCTTLLVADERHFDAAVVGQIAELTGRFHLDVPDHLDVPVIIAKARLRGWPVLPALAEKPVNVAVRGGQEP